MGNKLDRFPERIYSDNKTRPLRTYPAVLLVRCAITQQSVPAPEVKQVAPVAEASQPESPIAEAPDISILDAVKNVKNEVVKQHISAETDVNVKDKLGRTQLNASSVLTKTETTNLLRKHGSKTGEELKAEGK